jgi:hypothetical protein
MRTFRTSLSILALTIVVAARLGFASASAGELTGELGRDRAEAAPGREGGQASAPAPRGASGPPEHAKLAPINNLPNPYETVRNWGTLPDGRRWGSVSAIHVDIDGKHIWAGDRCGANVCAGSTVDPIVKLDPSGKVVRCAVGHRSRVEKVSRRQGQRPHGAEVQPARQAVDDAGHAWRGRRSAGEVHRAQ